MGIKSEIYEHACSCIKISTSCHCWRVITDDLCEFEQYHVKHQSLVFLGIILLAKCQQIIFACVYKHLLPNTNIVWTTLSVCLSVTCQHCITMAIYRIMQTAPHNNPWTVVFCCRRSWRNSNGITPNVDTKWRWGRVKSANFNRLLAASRKWYKMDA